MLPAAESGQSDDRDGWGSDARRSETTGSPGAGLGQCDQRDPGESWSHWVPTATTPWTDPVSPAGRPQTEPAVLERCSIVVTGSLLAVDLSSMTLTQWIWVVVPILLGAGNLYRATSDRPPFPISLSFLSPRDVMVGWIVIWLAAAIGTAIRGDYVYTVSTLTATILHALYFVNRPLHTRAAEQDGG